MHGQQNVKKNLAVQVLLKKKSCINRAEQNKNMEVSKLMINWIILMLKWKQTPKTLRTSWLFKVGCSKLSVH